MTPPLSGSTWLAWAMRFHGMFRASNDLGHWCRFFLQAVIETSRTGKLTLERLFVMKQEHDQLVLGMGRRAESAGRLLAHLYETPVIDTIKCMEINNLTKNSARGLIKEFESVGLLRETTGYKRNRQYEFTGYLDAFHAQNPE